MVTQDENLEYDELVLRRVPNNPQYIKPELLYPVQRLAFRPTDNDSDGLSVFRSLFTTPDELVQAGSNVNGYYVFKISYQEVLSLVLTIIPDPQVSQPSGHALIPEIESQYITLTKRQSKDIQQKLADIINQEYKERLLHSPL